MNCAKRRKTSKILMNLHGKIGDIIQIRKKQLDISSLIKYNFLMHYKNVTKEIKYDIKKMQGMYDYEKKKIIKKL